MKMNQKGFSLVELMIVVAIIGILATIGIPQYQKFQIKAKQSEAKTSLASVYTSMKAFQAEWGSYYNDFRYIGLQPEGNLVYNFGFNAGTPAIGGHPNNFVSTSGAQHFNAGLRCVAATATPTLDMPCRTVGGYANGWQTVNGTQQTAVAFRAHARARFNTTWAVDEWRMNQNKQLIHQVDGSRTN